MRIARARALAATQTPAAAMLRFYADVAAHQQALAARWQDAPWDPALVLGAIPETITWLERSAPPRLAAAVTRLRDDTAGTWRTRLDGCLAESDTAAGDSAAMFTIEIALQSLAGQCAPRMPSSPGHDNRCPRCQQRPVAGVLRDAGQGTRRALVCGLCFTEWGFERIVCPACGERKFDALPVYTAEQVAGARIEGCDTCGVYLKTLDASQDGTIIPEVDDIATLTLDLWAREHGYRRLRPSFYL